MPPCHADAASQSAASTDRVVLSGCEAVFLLPSVLVCLPRLIPAMHALDSAARVALALAVLLAIYAALYRLVSSVPAHALICLLSVGGLYALSL